MTQNQELQLANVDAWLSDYLDKIVSVNPHLGEYIRDYGFVAGGAVASLALGDVPRDVDVFFSTQAHLDLALGLAKMGLPRDRLGAEIISDTPRALTLEVPSVALQIVKRVVDRSELSTVFDFHHSCAAWTHELGLCLPDAARQAIEKRELVPTGSSLDITDSYDRALKFMDRGFTISNERLDELRQLARPGFHVEPKILGSGYTDAQRVQLFSRNEDNELQVRHYVLEVPTVMKLRRLKDHGLKVWDRGSWLVFELGIFELSIKKAEHFELRYSGQDESEIVKAVDAMHELIKTKDAA